MNNKIDIKTILDDVIRLCDHFYISEEDFRIDIVRAIKKRYPDSLVLCEYYNQKGGERIDVFVVYKGVKTAIELKYHPCPNRIKYDKDFVLKTNDMTCKKDKDSYNCIVANVLIKSFLPFSYTVLEKKSFDSINKDINKLGELSINTNKPFADYYYAIVLSNSETYIDENRYLRDYYVKTRSKNTIKIKNKYKNRIKKEKIIDVNNEYFRNFYFAITEIYK